MQFSQSLFQTRVQLGAGFNHQALLVRLFKLALPLIEGGGLRQHGDAGGPLLLHQGASDVLGAGFIINLAKDQ